MDHSKLVFPSREEETTNFVVAVENPLLDYSRVRSPRLREILDIWEAARAEGEVPAWSSFNPMAFPDLLPTISVFSNEGSPEKPDFLLRLEGDVSAELFNTPTSMTKVSEIESYAKNTWLHKHLNALIRNKKPIYIIRNLGWNNGRNYIEYEILALPFSNAGGNIVDRMVSFKIFHSGTL
ncbi:PAS domain-containing protein [Emcibacter nanhaiensis]|uniref:PAS domain-containing protein n=1 Tax=Emcibacter nanhaiensis TaxID=1505037 RepID=A0A501PNV7_9PROT|nr:PAS domain-containing protein [Emcibacter nanhaiensis]TPD61945.1 PAS domain-containing protein [Emcibacter nanhaiensis]